MSQPTTRTWSPYQQAIFDCVAKGEQNLVVIARAGSGKTSTIVEAVNRIPADKTVLVCAFNKSIAEEVGGRLRPGADCMTLHSLGFRALKKVWGNVRPDDHYALNVVRSVVPEDTAYDVVTDLKKVASLAMSMMAEDAATIESVMYAFDCAPPVDVDPELYVRWVQKALAKMRVKSAEICFDQMVYVPAVLNLRTGSYDHVIVDETQDMNRPQLVLAKNALKPGGQFMAVGDDRQGIYTFRGADSNSIRNIVDEMHARVLPLSVTYRCPTAVVDAVKHIVPDFEPAPGAIRGMVTDSSLHGFLHNVKPGDFVLSRKNAPLVKYCMKLLAAGKRAYIQGREVGAGLQAMIKKSKARTTEEFLVWLRRWRDAEVTRLTALEREDAIDAVADKFEVFVALSEDVATTQALATKIDNLFANDAGTSRVMFSTVHKAKGMEADRVWVFVDTFREGKNVEEDNLVYVAYTRAKKELFLVNTEDE
jgi:DNA helicase-2/ATP-dependent DNA helicase PcrA